MIGIEKGFVLNVRQEDSSLSSLVRPLGVNGKIVQVKKCPAETCRRDEIEYAVTALMPHKTTDLGVYITDHDRECKFEVVNGILEHRFRSDFPICQVIPEMQAWTYSLLEGLAFQFNEPGEIPILSICSHSEYFSLFRVKTPFELTTRAHPIYGNGKLGGSREFVGTELVAKIAENSSMKVYCSNGPYPGGATFLDYVHTSCPPYKLLLPTSDYRYVFHMLFGERDIRRQFEMWKIPVEGDLTRFLH
jgi:hypothetical protein